MSWRSLNVSSHGRSILLTGIAAGAWSATAVEAAGYIPGLDSVTIAGAAVSGALLGLPLGALVAPADSLLYRNFRRAAVQSLFGGFVAASIGAAGFSASIALLRMLEAMPKDTLPIPPYLSLWILVPVIMALLGACIGWASTINPGASAEIRPRLKAGLISGLLAGLPVSILLSQFGELGWIAMVSLALWGGVVALALFWREKRFAKRWLRVLSGTSKEQYFPLLNKEVRIGKEESNDIPLKTFEEIYPFHCRIHWNDDHYELVESDQGGMVLVNFRQVRSQVLKHGDLVKIGSALLQYGEAS